MGDSSQKVPAEEDPKHLRKLLIRGWLIVCGIALAFVLYGLFSFFVIGYEEPPDWDFGSIGEIPGQSIYSTHPNSGETGPPEPQHVDQKPPGAAKDMTTQPLAPTPGAPGKKE